MKLLNIACLAASLLLVACAGPSQTSAVDAAYVNRLNARLAQYNQGAAELDAALKQRFDAPSPNVQQASSPPPAAPVTDLPKQIFEDGEVHARVTILARFMNEAAASGQIGLMNSWLQDQTNELMRYSKGTDDTATQLKADLASKPKDPGLGLRVYNVIMERGAEQGAAEELLTLSNDVQGYARDYGTAAAMDQEREQERTRLLAAYLSAPRINIQAPSYVSPMSGPPTFTRCTAFMNSVNCMSH